VIMRRCAGESKMQAFKKKYFVQQSIDPKKIIFKEKA